MSQRYAVIEDATGTVGNVIMLADGATWQPPAGQRIARSDTADIGWTEQGGVLVEPPTPVAAPTPTGLIAYAAAKRWRVETGGFTLAGMQIASDATAQTKITATKTAFDNGTLSGTISFKTRSGWVAADAATVNAVYAALVAHVQACYATERSVSDAIAAGTITTIAQIDSAAWPQQ